VPDVSNVVQRVSIAANLKHFILLLTVKNQKAAYPMVQDIEMLKMMSMFL
jgi:hypothetical protein